MIDSGQCMQPHARVILLQNWRGRMSGRIVVIGASLSGIDALCELVSCLPAQFPAPIFITQHVASHSPGMLPHILSKAGPLPACHPRHLQLIERGKIYVAPPDRHMLITKTHIRLSHGPRENLARPAVDPLFRSAAMNFGPAAIGVVLTGQLDDGTAGLLAIKDCGGIAIVQEPSEATAPSMPQSALRSVAVDHRGTLTEIAGILTTLALDDPPSEEAAVTKLLDVENHIADGMFNLQDWLQLEQLSAPSGLNCPDCRSALYELEDRRILRYRCRSGHAYTALSLLSGQADARESHLSSLFGAFVEEASLAKRLLGNTGYRDDPQLAANLKARVEALESQATQASDWLHVMTGLVEPEPPA
jgi:two-component system chemotaxis response regulator CheB